MLGLMRREISCLPELAHQVEPQKQPGGHP